MNKNQLVNAIASEANITKVAAKQALEAVVKSTTSALKKGQRVALVGFGTFNTTKRAARKGRNPQNGKPIKIAAKRVVKFRPGFELAGAVNGK